MYPSSQGEAISLIREHCCDMVHVLVAQFHSVGCQVYFQSLPHRCVKGRVNNFQIPLQLETWEMFLLFFPVQMLNAIINKAITACGQVTKSLEITKTSTV